jgi:transcriptional regulator
MTPEHLKGNLDMLLLAVVARRPAHGYAIIEDLREQSGGELDLPEGTVYPALHRLEAAGLLKSAWSDEMGRRRRVYALTPKGNRSLARRQHEWRTFSRAVAAVMREGSWATS